MRTKNKMQYFETIILEEADKFIFTLDSKTQKKVFYNIRIAERTNDPELFKKLTDEIWEFRTFYARKQIRVLAFWDKTDKINTLVIATSGFIKKTQKTPLNEIMKAKQIMMRHFEEKNIETDKK